MKYMAIALIISVSTVIISEKVARSSDVDESIGKIWQFECDNKKKENSFNWETPYECCKKKEDDCKSSAENEDERKNCEERMKSCTTRTHYFRG